MLGSELRSRIVGLCCCRESRIQLFGGGAQLAGDAALDANNALGLASGSGSESEDEDGSSSEDGTSDQEEGSGGRAEGSLVSSKW